MSTPQNDVIPNGEEIVERFGGIRPMATKLDIAVTTVQGWKKRDAIPLNRKEEILAAAAEHGVNLKGLISGAPTQKAAQKPAANQSAPAASQPVSRIAEDPALTRAQAPVTPAAPAAPAAPRAPKADASDYVDLKRVRRTARTTSFFTTVGLMALVVGTGYVLFGGVLPKGTAPVSNQLAERVSVLEETGSTQTSLLGQLRGQVQDMTDAFGVNADDFRTMAQSVRQGNVQSVLQRLAGMEQYFAASGAPEGLQNMIRRMENTMSAPQGGADISAAVAELRSIVEGLQGQVGSLDTALADAQLENSSLSENLQGVSGRDLGAAAMLLTLTQVRHLIDRQAPFADDLALLQNLAGEDEALQGSLNRLAPYAESGVLSASGLKRELQGLSDEIISAKLRGEDLSFKDRAMARVNNLVSIQKDGTPVTGGHERTLVAKASAQLDAGDVQGALATLQQLDGAAAQAAKPWTAQAAATLAVDGIDQQLVENLVAKIRNMRSGANAPVNLSPRRAAPAAAPVTAPAPVYMNEDGVPDVIIIED